MAITEWRVLPGPGGRVSRGATPIPRWITPPSPYGTSVPGNAQGIIPPYGQIFPRGKT